MLSVAKIIEWPGQAMDALVEEGIQDGFRFISRLKQDWQSGTNRFSAEGEALFGAFDAGRLIAIGGINRQSGDCGRVRRIYVMKTHRRRGIGCQLVRRILDIASHHYARVVLRTDSEAADRFYVALGFVRQAADGGSTHALEFRKVPNTPP